MFVLVQRFTKIAKILTISFVFLGIITQSVPAEGLTGSQFKPGNIINNSLFYRQSSMSASSIQSFLNSKVPDCDTNGEEMYSSTKTRAQYGKSKGYPPPYICLKNKVVDRPARSAVSGLCSSIGKADNQKASQIIYAVSNACGVDSKVLIVMLQKEQALVTDDWPWSKQYKIAMGYGCPDTAPCDSEYFGFFNQVYNAAKQLKRYARDPQDFSYRAGRNNYIQYNPNASCGGKNVYIENSATAALYNYTPYVPNSAALNNLYGTGNSCSAYGNRNFWRMYSDWFGSTTVAYSGSVTETQIFSNSARTVELETTPSLRSGQKTYYTISVKNTGNRTWSNSFIRIGTAQAYNRASAFADNSWLNSGRPAALVESSVAPGATGTFRFSMTAPDVDGTYSEKFTLVAEGKTWITDASLTIPVSVSNPYNATIVSAKAYKNAGRTQPTSNRVESGSTVYWRITAKNIGQQTWNSSTIKVGTASPNDRASSLDNGTWLTENRPVRLSQSTIAPGATGTFDYSTITPSDETYLQEAFAVVAEGHSWMPNSNFSTNISSANDLETLNRDKTLYVNEELISGNNNRLVVQSDGNMVLYNSNYKALWHTRTGGTGNNNRLVVQSDGNMVLYNSNYKALWHTRTNGSGNNHRLILQNDGNLVLYNTNYRALWSRLTGKL